MGNHRKSGWGLPLKDNLCMGGLRWSLMKFGDKLGDEFREEFGDEFGDKFVTN